MTSVSVIVFFVTLLAALRLTRLAIHDVISRPFRDFLESREARSASTGYSPDEPGPGPSRGHRSWTMLVQLFDCPWCIGFWISAAAAAVDLDVANPIPTVSLWFTFPALTLALSWLVGATYTAFYTLELYEPPQHQH